MPWPDAGSSRPNGCCLEPGAGTEKGGAAKEKEENTARSGQKRRDPGGLRCARAALLGASASHTKGLASQSHRRLRGTVGSAQRGGAVAHSAPQSRPRPAPAPPRSHRPLRGRPHPYLCDPHAPPRLVPIPVTVLPSLLRARSRGDFSAQRRSRGPRTHKKCEPSARSGRPRVLLAVHERPGVRLPISPVGEWDEEIANRIFLFCLPNSETCNLASPGAWDSLGSPGCCPTD
ncbi:translation initiation factor IF-2-like [Cebus imitator]|uniref:translation initiation factor IF-2-like n=1 Tax=Cebus imitator TaxID=2715852 RepID=UPI00080A57EF|nr:translation initiation factor IF-2-like [Cebus imitator]